MLPKGKIFMHDIKYVIDMFLEEKNGEVLRSSESRQKKENAGAGIDRLVMFLMRIHTSQENWSHG